jgi:hypothetical protein
VPPLVSHSTIQSAPASAAARSVASAYSQSRDHPSKRCFRVENHLAPEPPKQPTLSAIMRRFSSRVVSRTRSTWSAELFPTSVHHWSLCGHQRLQAWVRFTSRTWPARASEGGDSGLAQLLPADSGEELRILGFDPGPTAFDVVDAERVECPGDLELSSSDRARPSRWVPS